MRVAVKLSLLPLIFGAALAAQIPVPQINLTGNVGAQGFPILNSGTLNFASDANHTMTVQESSATGGIKITSGVSLTATRSLVLPTSFGKLQFVSIQNATLGGQAIIVIGQSGTGITIPNGQSSVGVWYDGTNVTGMLASAGGISGQTANCAVKAATSTTATSPFPACDDGTKTTFTHPVAVNDGSGKNGSFGATAGTGNVTPAAGSVYYSQDGSDHATVAEGTNAYSRICSKANGACGTYYPSSFGAVCDGTTDDSAALQSMVNSVPSLAQIVIPPGKFCVISSADLVLPAGKTLSFVNDFTGGIIVRGNHKISEFEGDASYTFDGLILDNDNSDGTVPVLSFDDGGCAANAGALENIDNSLFIGTQVPFTSIVATGCTSTNITDLYNYGIISAGGNSTLYVEQSFQSMTSGGQYDLDSMQSVVINGLAIVDSAPPPTTGSLVNITNSLAAPPIPYVLQGLGYSTLNGTASLVSATSGVGTILGSGWFSGSTTQPLNVPANELSGFTLVPDSGISATYLSTVAGLYVYGAGVNPLQSVGPAATGGTPFVLDADGTLVDSAFIEAPSNSGVFSSDIAFASYVPGVSPIAGDSTMDILAQGAISGGGAITQMDVGLFIGSSTTGFAWQCDLTGNCGIGGLGMQGGGDIDAADLTIPQGQGAFEKFGLGFEAVSTSAISTIVPVKADTSNAGQVVSTTTSDTGAGIVLGVCVNQPGANVACNIAVSGVEPLTMGTGTCAIGQFVIVDTTTNGDVKCTSAFPAGSVIGVAMSAQSSVGQPVNVAIGLNSSGSGSAEVVSSSGTPTFSIGFNTSRMTLTSNVTTFTLPAGADGQSKTICFKQGSGPYTVAPPANVHGFFTVGVTNGDWNCQSFNYDSTDSIWLATTTGVINQ